MGFSEAFGPGGEGGGEPFAEGDGSDLFPVFFEIYGMPVPAIRRGRIIARQNHRATLDLGNPDRIRAVSRSPSFSHEEGVGRAEEISMNRKEERLLTPALSSTEEEREKRAKRRFGGSMRECIRGNLPMSRRAEMRRTHARTLHR